MQRRTIPTGNFANFMQGWISAANIVDDHQYTAEWSIEIVSSAAMIQRDEAPIFTVGTVNIGRSGQASASSTLAASWKESGSGDYNAAYPSFDAGNAADDLDSSIWISEKYVGAAFNETNSGHTNDATMIDNALAITQIHITQPAGQVYGYQWIELTALGSANWSQQFFVLATESGASAGFGGFGQLVPGDKVIICENKERFLEENPTQNAKIIFSLEESGSYGLLNRPLGGGGLGIFVVGSVGIFCMHYVVWGTGVSQVWFTQLSTNYYSPTWPGTPVDALQAGSGKTLRYNWANNATPRNNWTYDMIHYPGYKIGASGAKEWLLVELPAMELTLKADITSSFTGVTTLSKPGGDSNNGLPRSGSFTVQIGTEQMTASVSGDAGLNITARGQNGTSAVLHVAGDPVYLVDSGVATDAYNIKQIAWDHFGGTVHPKDFKIYTANVNSPRTPDETNYTLDYSTPITVTANASGSWVSSLISRRTRFILFECTLTTAAIGRVRLNSLKALVDESTFSSSTWITTGNAGDLIKGILLAIGVPSGGVTDLTTTQNLSDNNTGKGKAWTVVTDVADFCGVFIDIDLMSKVTIRNDMFWTNTTILPVSWTRSNASEPRFSSAVDAGYSQVTMKWRNAANTQSGVVTYPTTAFFIGEVKDLGEFIYESSSSASLSAQKKWLQLKFPYLISLTAAEDNHQVTAGTFHALTWAFDPNSAPAYRVFYATEVNHTVNDRTVTTTIAGNEIERFVGEQ